MLLSLTTNKITQLFPYLLSSSTLPKPPQFLDFPSFCLTFQVSGNREIAISFYRHGSVRLYLFCQARQCPTVPVLCENGSAETTVAEEGQNPAARLCGCTLGENGPHEPTSSYASIDFGCQLVASPATAASWMSVVGPYLCRQQSIW